MSSGDGILRGISPQNAHVIDKTDLPGEFDFTLGFAGSAASHEGAGIDHVDKVPTEN